MNGKVLERYAELMIDKIRQMSAGEWQKPWFTPRTGLPQNISGRPYNSMNRLMLYMEMDRMGYTLPVFMTFRQLKDENLMVIKGSHALPVTFYDITVKHKTTGEKISFDDYKSLPELQKQEYKVTPFMKHFYVFNIDQTDFKEKYPEQDAVMSISSCTARGDDGQEMSVSEFGMFVTDTAGNRPEPCKTENAVLYPETALRLRCANSGHQRKNFLISSKRIMITKR